MRKNFYVSILTVLPLLFCLNATGETGGDYTVHAGEIVLSNVHLPLSQSVSSERSAPPERLVPLADPFILLHDGLYYAYGTSAADGIVVMISHDLKRWKRAENGRNGLALHKDDSYGEKWFWAPEVYHVNGTFYMYYSAEEHICVATSRSPLGPFKQKEKKPMLEGEKAIDNSLFIDDDGTPYLFFDRFNDGLNIWVAELEDDLMTLKKETLHPCIHVSQAWEEVWPRVNEGCFVIKHEGVYYMTYSANSYESPFYGIGCATATDVMGEWTKYPHNPLLQKPGDLVGVGHSSMFKDKGGEWRIVFHAHRDKKNIHPRNMFISSVGFRNVNGENELYIDPHYEIPLLSREKTMMFGDTSRVGVPFSKDPHVVHFQGRYLMYYSIPPMKGVERSGWNIGIAESHDLITWEKVGEIVPHTDAEYEKNGLCAPGALVRDGKVHLFYQTYGNGRDDAICHAFSEDGVRFERNPTNPIFRPTGSWNCGRAIDAEVCEFNGRYYLYYATRDPDYKIQMLGVAVAPIDTDFSREDWREPVNASILFPELHWEGECIEGASITIQNNMMYMFYAGAYNNWPQQVGVAVSNDGLTWKRLFGEPFLPNGKPGEWNESESGHPHIFTESDGRTYLFFQGNNDKGKSWYISQKEVFWENGQPFVE